MTISSKFRKSNFEIKKKVLEKVETVFFHLLSNNQSLWSKNISYLVYLATLAVPHN